MGSKLNLSLPDDLSDLRAPASILDRSLAVVRQTTLGAPGSDIVLDPGIYAARAVLPDGRAFEAAFAIPTTAGVTDVTLNAAVGPAGRSGQSGQTGVEARSEPWFESVIVRERDPVQFDLRPSRAGREAAAGPKEDAYQAFPYAADSAPRVSLVALDASGEISAQYAAPVDDPDVVRVDRRELSRFARIERDGALDLYIAAPTSAAEGAEIHPSPQMPSGFELRLEDERADLLLRYLARGRLEQLTWLVADTWEAELHLGDRHAKPVAAAVGAYVILFVGAPSTGDAGHPRPDDWLDRWTDVLFQSAPWLVDGLCLRAESLARQGDHARALDLLLDLRSRGLPMFSGGLRFTLDRLTSYRTAAKVGKLDRAYVGKIDAVLDTLFRTAAGVDFDRPILTFRPSLARAAERRDGHEADSNLRQN